MPQLEIIPVSLLVGYANADLYGFAVTSQIQLVTHQLGSPVPFQIPPSYAIPPILVGRSRQADLKDAYEDLSRQSGMVIEIKPSPLHGLVPFSLEKKIDREVRLLERTPPANFGDFARMVNALRSIHPGMGVLATAALGKTPPGMTRGRLEKNIRFTAETDHPLGDRPSVMKIAASRRIRPSYWHDVSSVHIEMPRGERRFVPVNGDPSLIEEVDPYLSNLLGITHYLGACVDGVEIKGHVDPEGAVFLSRLAFTPPAMEIDASSRIEELHLYSNLAIGCADVRRPLFIWGGQGRESLQAIDEQFGVKGYILLTQYHTPEIIEATPHCAYRLSSGFEKANSFAMRYALKQAQDRAQAGEEFVFAHSVQAHARREKLQRYLRYSRVENSTALVSAVHLVANGREVGIRI